MRLHILSILKLCIIALLISFITPSHAASNPDIILRTEQDLIRFQQYIASGQSTLGNTYRLENDITCTNVLSCGDSNFSFKGTFDGNNYTISNLHIVGSDRYTGLFATISKEGKVKNLTVRGKVTADNYVGGIAGINYGTIEGCINYADVSGVKYGAGGIAGSNFGTITECANYGTVTCSDSPAGISGRSDGIISSCYNMGNIIGSCSGGIAGVMNHGWITSCYNRGKIESTELYAGGIAGTRNRSSTLINSYNAGPVLLELSSKSTAKAGGITALGPYNNSYFDKDSGLNMNDARLTGASVDNNLMKHVDFVDTLNRFQITQEYKPFESFEKEASNFNLNQFLYDSDNINDGYPILWWQKSFLNKVELKDIENHWAENDIKKIVDFGFMRGIGNGFFEPDRNITRAEFAMVMANYLELTPIDGRKSFSDVSLSNIFHGHIEAAYDAGIIKGVGEGRFEPNETITKVEAVAIVVRSVSYRGHDVVIDESEALSLISRYMDGFTIPKWATEEVGWGLKSRLLNQKNNFLRPEKSVTEQDMTRGETANIIMNSVEYIPID